MKKVSDFVLLAKRHYGDPHMSDRQLGQLLGGYSSSQISDARLYDKMSDHLAGAIEDAMSIEPGMIVVVARAAREKHPDIRRRLESFAKNVVGRVPQKALGALCALGLALGLLLQPQQQLSSVGGEGGIRTLGTGIPYA